MSVQTNIYLPDIVGGGYGDFWRFKGRYRVCKGSRASKKSKTTALNIIYRMMQYPEANTLVVRQVFNTLRDSCYSDLKWAAQRLGVMHLWEFIKSPLGATYKPTGQQIFFRGLDDAYKIASISVPVGYLCWLWLEEAFEVENEDDFNMLDESIRGEIPDYLFKQITVTFNPWYESHWLKKRFFDAPPSPDIMAKTTNYMCNEWLDAADMRMFEDMKERNPKRYKVAGLGDWGIEGGAVFEEFINDESNYYTRKNTHVIAPFEIPTSWNIYRSFDFGYAKPFSCAWWAVDYDGRLYRILELYGCVANEPDTGVKWSPDEIFKEIRRIEDEHRWLAGKKIYGVADPAIWDASHGESIAETAEKYRVYFEQGDNKRLAGWMQVHYRLQFDSEGIPMMYIFSNCKGFIRTIPVLMYDENKPEDVNTKQEDHIADEVRYMCMMNPMKPVEVKERTPQVYDPLSTDDGRVDRYAFMRRY